MSAHTVLEQFSLLYMSATMHCYISLLIRIIHRTMIYDLFISKRTFQTFLLIEFCQILAFTWHKIDIYRNIMINFLQ